MSLIYVPSHDSDDWRQFLAQPAPQWVTGYSARILAYAWERAPSLPQEVREALETVVREPHLLLALPEHEKALPAADGKARATSSR